MKRVLGAALVLLVVCSVSVFARGSSDDGAIKIAMMPKFKGENYFDAVKIGAEECVAELNKNGKVVFIGCEISANTFLHFLEDSSGAKFLSAAIVKIKEPDGRLRTEMIPRHLPGHRDFYRRDALNGKFYQRAVERGLEIRTAALGAGKATVMELRQLYDIGMRLIKDDPRILLCDDPDCQFCSKF